MDAKKMQDMLVFSLRTGMMVKFEDVPSRETNDVMVFEAMGVRDGRVEFECRESKVLLETLLIDLDDVARYVEQGHWQCTAGCFDLLMYGVDMERDEMYESRMGVAARRLAMAGE